MKKRHLAPIYGKPGPMPVMRKDGKVASISDIFALRKEATVIATIIKAKNAEKIDKVFHRLIQDLTRTCKNGDYDTKHWNTTINAFVSLTPYYKANLRNVNLSSMAELLRATRLAVGNLHKENPRKWKQRKRKGSPYDNLKEQEMVCLNPDRLTPLRVGIYRDFYNTLIRRRLGHEGYANVQLVMHPTKDYTYGTGIWPTILTTGIRFFTKTGSRDSTPVNEITKASLKECAGYRYHSISKLATLVEKESSLGRERKGDDQ